MFSGCINQTDMSSCPTLWSLPNQPFIYKSCPVQFNYSCWDISMRRCVVHCTPASHCVSESQQFSSHAAVPPQRWPCTAGRLRTQFINITWCTMEPLAAHPSDSKGGRLSCQSLIQEGGYVVWIRKMLSFYGGQRDVKGALEEGWTVCVGVCECGLLWQEHFPDLNGQ